MEEKYLRTHQKTQGSFLVFREDEVVLSNGRTARRDLVLHPGAVAVLALTPAGEMVMVRQYRYPVGEVLYEIPAGKLNPGEDPLDTARRELREETGLVAGKMTPLTTFYTGPGFTDETMYLFLAEDLVQSQADPDPDEIIEYEKIPLDRVWEMVKTGELRDAKTLVGLLWLTGQVPR